MPNSKDRFQNQLLTALREKDRSELAPFLTHVLLRTGTVLAEPYTSLKYLYFPHESLVAQVAQSAVCSRFHSIEQRLARWILASRDRTRRNSFPYTQEFLGHMLGADRSSVTIAAGLFKRAGLIDYRRGSITVIDSKGLEKLACECYSLLKREFQAVAHPPA